MAMHSAGSDMAGAVAPRFVLDRREAVPALIGTHQDFLIVTGLAGTSRDMAALTEDGAHTYTMAGAMGGACMIGLGLALARRDKQVLVVTGDGELLMNIGALATIAVMNPPNLSDHLRRQRPLRRDRLPEEPHQPRRRSGEDRGRLRHQAHAAPSRRRPRSPPAPAYPRGQRHLLRAPARQADRAAQLQARPRPRQHTHPLPRVNPARRRANLFFLPLWRRLCLRHEEGGGRRVRSLARPAPTEPSTCRTGALSCWTRSGGGDMPRPRRSMGDTFPSPYIEGNAFDVGGRTERHGLSSPSATVDKDGERRG